MTVLYADTSAIARAYLSDELDHSRLRELLLEGPDHVVSSSIARVELASAVRTAGGVGRMRRWQGFLERFDADCEEDGPLTLLALRDDVVFQTAYKVVLEHRLRPLDAIHVAVALEELADEDDLLFVTRDSRQASAARALGLTLR